MDAIDTNILVYAFDTAYPSKRAVCKNLVQSVFEGRRVAVLTNQILAEFAFAVMRKIERPMSREEVEAIIGAILSSPHWKVFNYTAHTLHRAVSSPHPFWDALIIQTLKENNVHKIITENTKDFAASGVIPSNPFSF